MKIKLKIEAENGNDLREQLEALLGVYGGAKQAEPKEAVKQEPVEEVKQEPKKRAKKADPVTEEKAEETKPVTKETPTEEAKEEEQAEEGGITKDVLVQALLAQNRSGKKEQVKALLAEFGVPRITQLKESDYAPFHAKLIAL